MHWYDFFLAHPTDWLLALFNLLLVIFTARLWIATRSIVSGAEDTAKKQLRAYVALENIFFAEMTQTNLGHLVPIGDQNALKIRVRNHGQTPAHRMTIWGESIEKEPAENFDYPYAGGDPIVGEQMLHPSQQYSTRVPLQRFSRRAWGYCVYGRMVYQDIYGRWWVTRFCYLYEGEDRFTPYGPHNKEDGPYAERPF